MADIWWFMMTSSNGNVYHVTGHLCGNSPVPGELTTQRPVTWSFDVFFDLRLNKRLSKQSWGRWFETLSHVLWRQCNVLKCILFMKKKLYFESNSPKVYSIWFIITCCFEIWNVLGKGILLLKWIPTYMTSTNLHDINKHPYLLCITVTSREPFDVSNHWLLDCFLRSVFRPATTKIWNFRKVDNCTLKRALTHWGQVTHICVNNLTIIGSDNG